MSQPAPIVDAEACVRDWVNARTDLWGDGNPIEKGAHLRRLRSPLKGAYLLLGVIGGTIEGPAEAPWYRARVSASAYGLRKEGAIRAAVAYARAVSGLQGTPTQMGSGVCIFTAAMSGPIDLSELDESEPRYAVDADFYFQ